MSEEKVQDDAVPAEVWDRLRQAREAMGLSVGDVSAYLKLTVRQIEAIERGELSALPGEAFARGFVRNYARFLGLDPAEFLQPKPTHAVAPKGDSAELAARMNPNGLGAIPVKASPRTHSLLMAGVVLLLFVLLFVAWYFRWLEPREEELLAEPAGQASGVLTVASAPAQSVPVASASAPDAQQSAGVENSAPIIVTVSAPVIPVSAPAAAVVSSPAPVQSAPARAAIVQSAPAVAAVVSAPLAVQSGAVALSFGFEGDSWVSVRDSAGKILMSGMNVAGSAKQIQGVPPLFVKIGNAPTVKLTWRGKPIDLTPYIKANVASLNLQ